ncbi:MAG: hydantoinase B/oxoprolinase family protein [Alphaproteobacteria bacterium]|jgi:5-oxoprolinase (ATP-hydrolysing)|nr:hydantoinase B/oxoprolinase family protein [Alphaproteobacteria bacterium]MDP6515774.1 hydantoinase B/oxoprolinase family protein [Alphaproteobacteria bacterium]
MTGWQFWIDRGGTFTDIVAKRPDGALISHKLLSENPGRYDDAALRGIRDVLGLDAEAPLGLAPIDAVKMGTTVATNALLERRGERTVLAITEGFADALRIGTQNRPRLFDREIVLPEMLYEHVVEIEERVDARGAVLRPVNLAAARSALAAAAESGIRSCAVVLMHGYRYPAHEQAIADLARDLGFDQVSASHRVSPLMKLISRGDTTVTDAYLSPILRRYVDRVAAALGETLLMFMQSNGGLTDARRFQGKDSILSGPAGGVVGAVRTAAMAGFDKIIGFDMGGTSTDVSHYDGTLERTFDSEIGGVRLRSPMMRIHTVAAGGGSILDFDGARYRVGPESAGADPGPACYRRGGPLTLTDCNVMLGKLAPAHFPHVFGARGDQPIDAEEVRGRFAALAARIRAETGDGRTPEQVAEGFLKIAVENMANAIKHISIQRGYDVTEYTLAGFGAAAGQHACLVADALGMGRIFIHPLAGVLSAYGMGLADIRVMRERAVEARLAKPLLPDLEATLAALEGEARAEMADQGVAPAAVTRQARLHLRYEGTDAPLEVPFGDLAEIMAAFEAAHEQRYGFSVPDKAVIVEAAAIELIGATETVEDAPSPLESSPPPMPLAETTLTSGGARHTAPIHDRTRLRPGHILAGPAIVVEPTATTMIESGWQARVTERDHLVLTRITPRPRQTAIGTDVDPVMLEVFNNLFMSIAEQMGSVLENTSHSVNMKERLDFSCAVFDPSGQLVANAPHMPVHLGSMGESVRAIIESRSATMAAGDVFMLNAPYAGGTHLPDVTVITPVFDEPGAVVLFHVASRGHHADIGGITPGSMPPDSRTVEQEGVLIEDFQLLRAGRFLERETRALLASGRYPARNIDQNIADLQAQIAANHKGVAELGRMVGHFGLDVVQAYMGHVQANACESVRRVLDVLTDSSFTNPLDDGSRIRVAISIDRAARRARIDFTGTSPQQPSNFNAPLAVCRAAVLYVFRTLVDDDIPMNEGCLEPLEIVVPEGCMLSPRYPAAVVAGNVETSQMITDTLYGALGVLAASQGTMNNFTFGDARWQYYETICGGAGAGPDFDGTSAVHTHMTNSRLTDPEVLEWRFPVLLESFAIRSGSGGAGTHPGGDGCIRRVRFLAPMTAAILSSHRVVAPFGSGGGAPGAIGVNRIERSDGRIEPLGGCDRAEMAPGDVFVIETPGGGGFGPVADEA